MDNGTLLLIGLNLLVSMWTLFKVAGIEKSLKKPTQPV